MLVENFESAINLKWLAKGSLLSVAAEWTGKDAHDLV